MEKFISRWTPIVILTTQHRQYFAALIRCLQMRQQALSAKESQKQFWRHSENYSRVIVLIPKRLTPWKKKGKPRWPFEERGNTGASTCPPRQCMWHPNGESTSLRGCTPRSNVLFLRRHHLFYPTSPRPYPPPTTSKVHKVNELTTTIEKIICNRALFGWFIRITPAGDDPRHGRPTASNG